MESAIDGPSIDEVSGDVIGFLEDLLDEVRRDWVGLLEDFFLRQRFDPEQIPVHHPVNKRIGDHPGIRWSLERLKKGDLQRKR